MSMNTAQAGSRKTRRTRRTPKAFITEDLKKSGSAIVIIAGFIYDVLFRIGYNLTKYNTMLPGGDFKLLLAELLIGWVIGTAIVGVLFYAVDYLTEDWGNKMFAVSAKTAETSGTSGSTEISETSGTSGSAEISETSGMADSAEAAENRKSTRAKFIFSRKAFPALWAIIFACWIPAFLSSYPGIFSYDSNLQFNWYFNNYWSNHHPIIHTWYMGAVVDLGHTLFGTYQAGAVMYTISQMLMMSAIFAGICVYLGRRNAPKWLLIGMVVFYGIYPANVYLSMAAAKDGIFSALFALYFAQIVLAIRDGDSFFGSWKRVLLLIATTFALLILRNNFYYSFLMGIIPAIVVFRKHWKGALIAIILPILLFKLYTGPLYSALGVVEVDPREAYSIIIQPIARTYNLAKEDFTDEDLEILYKVIPDEYLTQYCAHKTDPVKWGFDTEAFNENKSEFINLWIRQGVKHPLMYVDGLLSTVFGLFYPWDVIPDSTTERMYVEYFFGEETQDILGIHFDPKLPEVFHEISYAICQDGVLTHIPFFGGLLFGAGIFIWILGFVSMYLLYKGDWKFLFAILLPMWAYFCSLLLGPVACMRYNYPYMTSLPLLIYEIALWRKKN